MAHVGIANCKIVSTNDPSVNYRYSLFVNNLASYDAIYDAVTACRHVKIVINNINGKMSVFSNFYCRIFFFFFARKNAVRYIPGIQRLLYLRKSGIAVTMC